MDNKIHLIMPMAGKGSRFFSMNGGSMPKPLINLNGKPFFYWAARSISKYVNLYDITFVVLKEHVEKFNIDRIIKEYFESAKIVVIPKVLNGATLSSHEAKKENKDDGQIIINDCDHMFIANKLYDFLECEKSKLVDGALITFYSDDPKFSYAKLDENGRVIAVAEKEVISDKAICGAYFFKDKYVFEESIKKYVKSCMYGELFISGLYDIMIRNNKKIVQFDVDIHVSYGVPEEYEGAKKSEMFKELM